MIFDEKSPQQGVGYVHLYPRYDGDYTLPKEEK
jgi:hypothetical protein